MRWHYRPYGLRRQPRRSHCHDSPRRHHLHDLRRWIFRSWKWRLRIVIARHQWSCSRSCEMHNRYQFKIDWQLHRRGRHRLLLEEYSHNR